MIPDDIEALSAAGVPVAYLTAQMTLSFAGFAKGKTVLAPAIGGSVGNAVTQLARAQGGEARYINDNQSCEGATSTLIGLRRSDRPF